MYFSRKTAGLPKARPASLRALRPASQRGQAALVTTRIPRPPPPNAAFTMSTENRFLWRPSRLRPGLRWDFPFPAGSANNFLGQRRARPPCRPSIFNNSGRGGPQNVMFASWRGLGKIQGVLGQKSMASGVNEVHALFLRQRDDAGDIEMRADRPLAFADEIGFIGLETGGQKAGLPVRRLRRSGVLNSVAARKTRMAISLRVGDEQFG